MRLGKKRIFGTAIIRAAIITVGLAILPPGATGQQSPEQPMSVTAGEVTDPNTEPVDQNEPEQLFSLGIDDAEIREVLRSFLVSQAGLSLVLTGGAMGLAIWPHDATGQQSPERPMSVTAGEATDPNTKPVDQNEPEQLFSVSIDDAEIKDVLESLLVPRAGLSLVLPAGIEGRVSLRLENVTWETMLDAVLQAGGYSASEKNNILFVSDSKKILTTEAFNLNFANATDIEKTVSNLLSSEGKLGIDDRLNCIVVTDSPTSLEQIRQAIGKLDVRAPQVMIEVLILNVQLTDELKMGVDWTALGTIGTLSTAFSQGLKADVSGQLNFSRATSDWTLTGLIDFIEDRENVKILANPKVLVLNNHTATIDSVTEIPYQQKDQSSEGGAAMTSTAFKEAGIKLEVTPQITDDGYIIMHIKPEQSAQIGMSEGSDIPVIETRKADTTLRVKDGQTIIIGGLRKKQPSVKESKIPILGDIPLIGFLFRRIYTEQIESELGVFITPHIYTEGTLSDEELKLLHSNDESKSVFEASDLLRLQPNDYKNR